MYIERGILKKKKTPKVVHGWYMSNTVAARDD